MTSDKMRVAVIGAGAAGLCCARHLLSRPQTYSAPVVFEMSGKVGGTWVYTKSEESDSFIHSSMYRDLRTNLPKEIMAFPDFPFDSSLPSFVHHSEVLRYLEKYADRFCIRPHIRFNCRVVSVFPVLGEEKNDKVSWDVTFHTESASQPVTQRFDAIMVCVGHYSHPFIPDIPGIETFQGKTMHSHLYRFPETFSSRSVVLLGCGPSGVDIAVELASHAKQVTLSHRGPSFNWTLPENMTLAPPVVRATPHSLICEDGTQLSADTLIFCTGYKYYYPFLLPEEGQIFIDDTQENGSLRGNRCLLESEKKINGKGGLLKSEVEQEISESILKRENGVEGGQKPSTYNLRLLEYNGVSLPDMGQGHLPPLYKHILHAHYPTMCFVGACKIVVPFPLFHCQALFFLAFLEGKCQLPPQEQILSESQEELMNYLSSGLAPKYLHRLEKCQWEYNRWLAKVGGFEPLPPVLDKLYEACSGFRKCNPILYRNINFEILSRDEFRVVSYGHCASMFKDTHA
ncbi:uncharacterized protein O3C94_008089 [Discoglossus pictus]